MEWIDAVEGSEKEREGAMKAGLASGEKEEKERALGGSQGKSRAGGKEGEVWGRSGTKEGNGEARKGVDRRGGAQGKEGSGLQGWSSGKKAQQCRTGEGRRAEGRLYERDCIGWLDRCREYGKREGRKRKERRGRMDATRGEEVGKAVDRTRKAEVKKDGGGEVAAATAEIQIETDAGREWPAVRRRRAQMVVLTPLLRTDAPRLREVACGVHVGGDGRGKRRRAGGDVGAHRGRRRVHRGSYRPGACGRRRCVGSAWGRFGVIAVLADSVEVPAVVVRHTATTPDARGARHARRCEDGIDRLRMHPENRKAVQRARRRRPAAPSPPHHTKDFSRSRRDT
ncbi:hypothetical protein C8J57DRAFT_1213057 [Mycena rebaudengoi]|nr:hypothetical protein C8J57DRAFT_1213057 [Mycena rebaudengoi]